MTYVYFAAPIGNGSVVKIGKSRCPSARMCDLGWSIRRRVELLAQLRGDQRLERRFHLRFLDSWIGGEWFDRTDDLSAAIEQVREGTFDCASLPPQRSLPRELLWRSVAAEKFLGGDTAPAEAA